MKDGLEFLGRASVPLTCIGTGLVALDIFKAEGTDWSRFWAGGSCANVLIILSYLGWDSYPIARIGEDVAARALLADLRKFDVRTDWILQDIGVKTPIILERLYTGNDGAPAHKFEFVCPDCGSWFPRYRPVLARLIAGISGALPTPKVFYFDRVSRAAIELARNSRNRGALVFFEPSGTGDEKLFVEALCTSDIVKYSRDRLQPDLPGRVKIPLEVETLGRQGLRYRLSGGNWKLMQSYQVQDVRDTAGAGDWCSAGLIHALGKLGVTSIGELSHDETATVLHFGQLLAGVKCTFQGPRGCMYGISEEAFESVARSIIRGKTPNSHITMETRFSGAEADFACPVCGSERR